MHKRCQDSGHQLVDSTQVFLFSYENVHIMGMLLAPYDQTQTKCGQSVTSLLEGTVFLQVMAESHKNNFKNALTPLSSKPQL